MGIKLRKVGIHEFINDYDLKSMDKPNLWKMKCVIMLDKEVKATDGRTIFKIGDKFKTDAYYDKDCGVAHIINTNILSTIYDGISVSLNYIDEYGEIGVWDGLDEAMEYVGKDSCTSKEHLDFLKMYLKVKSDNEKMQVFEDCITMFTGCDPVEFAERLYNKNKDKDLD